MVLHLSRVQADIGISPFSHWRTRDGFVWGEFYRQGRGYYIRFPGLADFSISPDYEDIQAWPVPAVQDGTVEHLYLNQVWPLVLSQRDLLVLHGSAIVIDGAAVAFLGPSGRGKSTLAASFATNGFQFLTDDGLVLSKSSGRHIVQPSHPSIRLWDDSRSTLLPKTAPMAPAVAYTPKARMLACGDLAFCDESLPLCMCILLGDDQVDCPRFTPIRARDAVVGLVGNSFLLDGEDKERLRRHYSGILDLVSQVPVFRFDYPRRFDLLAEVRRAIVAQSRPTPRAHEAAPRQQP